MADRYVDFDNGADGTGGHDGTTMLLAWKTCAYAKANAPSGSTIHVMPGTTASGDPFDIDGAKSLTFQSYISGYGWKWDINRDYGHVRVYDTAGAFGSYIIKDAGMSNAHAYQWIVSWHNPSALLTGDATLRFENCLISAVGTVNSSVACMFALGVNGDPGGTKANGFDTAGNVGRILEVVNSTITANEQQKIVRNASAKRITFDHVGGSYSKTTNGWATTKALFDLTTDATNQNGKLCGTFEFLNSPGFAFSGTLTNASYLFYYDPAPGCSYFHVEGNTFSGINGAGLIYAPPTSGGGHDVMIRNNAWGSITADASAETDFIRILYSYVATGGYSIGTVTIDGNTMTLTGAGGQQVVGVLIGPETQDSVEVINNWVISNTGIGIYFNLVHGAVCHHNVVKAASSAICRVGTVDCLFHHNTEICVGGASLNSGGDVLRDSNENPYPDGSNDNSYRNIIVSIGGNQAMAYASHDAPGAMDLTTEDADYNLYWNTDSAKDIWASNATGSTLNGKTLASLQDFWVNTIGGGAATNDAHSDVADPLFVDYAGGDFRPQSSRAYMNGDWCGALLGMTGVSGRPTGDRPTGSRPTATRPTALRSV